MSRVPRAVTIKKAGIFSIVKKISCPSRSPAVFRAITPSLSNP
jgi:hypothetical protein